MQYLARLLLTATVFGMFVAIACHTRPAWLADMHLDVWSLPELWEKLEVENGRAAALDATLESIQERVRRKNEATQQLIAGKRSLLQTAALYRKLSKHTVEFGEYVERTWPAMPEAEALCRYTIESVGLVLMEEPEKARTVTARLQRELDELLRGGTLTLPSTR